jgi:hypothetical protein
MDRILDLYTDRNQNHSQLLIKCVQCDHLLVGDEVEYLRKGKSYCEDCYRYLALMRIGAERTCVLEKIVFRRCE